MNQKRWAYGPGFITETPQGTYSCFVALGHGKRRRAVVKTLSEAKAWILAGTAGEAPDRLIVEDALRARARLPDGVSLEDAARYYAEHHKAAASRTSLAEAWAIFEPEARASVGPRTLAKYRNAATRLAAAFPGVYVGDLDSARIEDFLRPVTPTARNNLLAGLSVFFNFCVARGMADESPLRTVRKARIRKAPPSIFTVDEARAILDTARKTAPATVPYFALCLFAGLRPEEAMRMRPANILNGYVVLTAKETKTGDARTVPILPNLAAWLDAYPMTADRFSARAVKALRAAVGFPWKQDGARHSYASYLFERTKDAAAVAATMGHVGTEVFYRHYRALAAPGTGEAYFSIRP